MRKAFDRLDRQENRTQWKSTAGIAGAFGFVVFALVALTWSSPAVTNWVLDGVQAEFIGTMAPDPAPVQTAQPAKGFQTVRAN
jgi:hypothetical protein